MTSLAVDLGGTRTKLGLVQDGIILKSHVLPAGPGLDLRRHMRELEAVMQGWAEGAGEAVAGVAIAFAGLVNPVEKRVISVSGKYYNAREFDFSGWCRAAFHLPLVMENDANAALLGEVYYGCAKGFHDAVIMILGTGVGTAAMMDARLLRGKHFQAGCLGGHFSVSQDGRACSCGGTGCVESNASSWVLPVMAREQPDFDRSGLRTEEVLDFLALEKWVLRGDALALRLLEHFNGIWSAGIKNLIHAYDPEVVILSGGVLKCGDMIVGPVTQKVRSGVWTPWGEIAFKTARNPEHSVLLGLHHMVVSERSKDQ